MVGGWQSGRREKCMDDKDEQILDLMKGNARISYQELGDVLGISRVAAMKRVRRLEEDG
ncbi:MAG: AsnC family transcriptional regulator, partial [Lachnospiraceae bacterium]|nr:AsnC family transcriptional regulator [Lachnospiraceae bacterium]